MALSTSLISGLASGIDWRTMITQLIAIERRRVDLVEDQKTEYESKLKIFQAINTKLLTFKTQAETLASSNAFNVFTTSLTTNSTTYNASDFLTVTTSTSAAPGTHEIEMTSNSTVAEARKISSRSFTSYDTALVLTGEFVINGRAVRVDDTDDLMDIRDKINNLNTGTNATGVTASILTVSSSDYRLILTSDNTGEDAFTIFDASSETQNILSSGLGFTDGNTSVKNYISNGVQSEAFSSSSQSVSSMLGITTAQTSTTIEIGSVGSIELDLSKSLTELASDINTAVNGTNISASVVPTTENNVTTYRLKIINTTTFVDDNHVLETLGILDGDQGNVQEVHQGSSILYDDENNLLDPDNKALNLINMTALRIATDTSAGVAIGDTIRVMGTKTDGTTVDETGIVETNFTTVQDFVDWVDLKFSTGGDPVNNVTVTFDDGLIKITDDNAGDSQLSITIVAYNDVGEGKLDFGTVSATTEGYTMEVQTGQDANVIIDGTTINSSSNIIDDVIAGVTLNLLTVESEKTVNLTISRDYDTIKSSVQGLLDAYNDVLLDINEQFYYDEETQSAGILQGDSTLSSIRSSLQNIVVSSITGLSSTMNALSLIGINSNIDYSDPKNNGMLYIDNDDFMDALEDNFNALRRIFVAEGSTTDGDVQYIAHTNDTVAGDYDVNITQAATQAEETGSVDLDPGGIGAGDIEVLTITQGSKIAAITLDGDTGENGSSIDNIVNAINSELDTEYAQSIMGSVKNTDGNATTAITSSTLWKNVWSDGSTAGLLPDEGENDHTYVIGFSGTKSNGTAVSGSYTISDAGVDTVQGLLSAIEAAYENEVSAGINTYGYLVITNNTNCNSRLSIDFDYSQAVDLNFGDVTTSNLVGSVRNTVGEDEGGNAIDSSTKLEGPAADAIYGSEVIATDVFRFSGYTASGKAVEGSYTVIADSTVGDLLTAIETAYETAYPDGTVVASIQDGRIVITDGDSNSTLGIEIFEPAGKGVDFGTLGGGVTGRYAVTVTASNDESDYLVLTSDDYGSGTSFTISQSRHSDAYDYQDYNQIIYTNTANTTDASGGDIYITSSTTWDDIYGAGTIENGDTITISGTDRAGGALDTGTPEDLIYTIDVTKDIGDLLSRIVSVFGADDDASSTVEARIEQGKIVVEQTSPTGDSSISLTLAYEDIGGSGTGTLDLGTFDQSTERDLDLGLVNGTRSGLDVVGTINNESATGSGQALVGDKPGIGDPPTSVEGLTIRYTGTTTGDQGTVKITMGVAELFDRALYDITNIADGYLDYRMESMADRVDDLEDNIEEMEDRLNRKMEMMINRFVAMEVALSKIQNQSNWLTGQINASYSGWWAW